MHHLIDTLPSSGCFIDILSLMAYLLCTFSAGPANELYQAAYFAKIMKVKDSPKVNIISNAIYWFQKRVLFDQVSFYEKADEVNELIEHYISLTTLYRLCEHAKLQMEIEEDSDFDD